MSLGIDDWIFGSVIVLLVAAMVVCAFRYSKGLTVTLGVVALFFAASIWAYGQKQTGWAYAAMGAMGLPLFYIVVRGFIASRSCKNERARVRCTRLADRPALTFDELHAAFYKQSSVSRPLMEEAWTTVARTLRIPPGKVRPSDRFDAELAVPLPKFERECWYNDEMSRIGWAIDDLVEGLLELVPLGLDEFDAIPLDTVDDFVRLHADVNQKTEADARAGFAE